MIYVQPLPDELDRGYLGRSMRWNGFQKEKEFVDYMASCFGVKGVSRRDAPLVMLLSRLAELPIPTFVKQHTTLPFRRGITSYLPGLEHGSEQGRSMLWSSGMRIARPGAYFCVHCVLSDLTSTGVTYWRRIWQLPGHFVCQQHREPLRYVTHEKAFQVSPAAFLFESLQVPNEWMMFLQVNPAIQRFIEIADYLMTRPHALDVRDVSCVLKAQADKHGLQTYAGPVKLPLLSDLVTSQFDPAWVQEVFHELTGKHRGDWFDPIDGVLCKKTSASSVIAYMLATAVLYPDTKSAIEALSSAKAVSVWLNRGKSSKIVLNVNRLRELYIEERGSHAGVAQQFPSTAAQIVTLRLNELGLPNLSQQMSRNQKLFDGMVAFLEGGSSLTEAAEKSGVTVSALEILLRRSSVGLLQALQAMPVMPAGGNDDWANCQADGIQLEKNSRQKSSVGKRSSYRAIRRGSLLLNASTASLTGAR
ncbi:TniQ family protein [Vogesella amnigena]|uniref:TniQ family protein n=1 Tax=Vogesella amnigena TaxID=1507449 RepID=A0ABV7TW49_9NEIS